MPDEDDDQYHYALPPDHKFHSPYLPSNNILLNDDGYIYFNSEKPVRGRIEHSFFEIGMAVLTGGAIGSVRGYLEGKNAAIDYPQKLKNVVVFNHIVKKCSLGNSFGIVATIYATTGVVISEMRGSEVDGPANSFLAATITGLLYRTPGGAQKIVKGGLVGATVGSLLALWQGRSYIIQHIKSRFGFA